MLVFKEEEKPFMLNWDCSSEENGGAKIFQRTIVAAMTQKGKQVSRIYEKDIKKA